MHLNVPMDLQQATVIMLAPPCSCLPMGLSQYDSYMLNPAILAPGTLPSSWSALTKLTELYIKGGGEAPSLIGTLPGSWGSLTQLKILELSGLPSVEGPLPPFSWTQMQSLQSVYLAFLPKVTVDQSPLFAWLNVSGGANLTALRLTSLAGLVNSSLQSPEFSNLPNGFPNLNWLTLTTMSLKGTIPNNWQWFKLNGLRWMNLSENTLEGVVPDWLPSIMGNGSGLDLSRNSLIGKCPCCSSSTRCLRCRPTRCSYLASLHAC